MPTRLPLNEMEIRSIARNHTRSMIAVLIGVARQKTAQPGARVAAAIHILDRGWGKADQTHTVDSNISVTIRHILEHIDDKPVVVDGRCVEVDTTVVKKEDDNSGV